VAKGMRERGTSVRQLARQLGVTEGALRYRFRRSQKGDGRADQPTALDGYEEVVQAVQERLGDGRLGGEGRPCQVRAIYEALVREHGYRGSYQAVVRHLRRRYGKPKVRALRRVETPPGVQAQHDWFAYSGDSVHEFRRKPSSGSGASRPPVPVHSVHPVGAKRRWRVQDSTTAGVWLFFRRMDAPFRVIVWALWTSRSRMASANVASPMTACQCSTGSWLVTRVARRP
jgi:AcrR family transcriptional regulator